MLEKEEGGKFATKALRMMSKVTDMGTCVCVCVCVCAFYMCI